MKTKKIYFQSFSSTDEKLAHLHSMSKEGWQLADVRICSEKYVRDTDAVYRYAVNAQHELTLGEFREYRAEFEAHGWSYVTRCGDLYFFRKPYDPQVPEAAYLLKPDRETQDDRKERISDIAFIVLMLAWILYYPCVSVLFICIWYLLVCGIPGFRQTQPEENPPPSRRLRPGRHILIFLMLLSCLIFLFACPWIERGTREVREYSSETGRTQRVIFTVKLPDIYGIYAGTYEPDVTEVPFTITDENGHILSSGILSADREMKANRFLLPGRYALVIEWQEARTPERPLRYAGIGASAPLIPGLPWWLMIPVISIAASIASHYSQARRIKPNRKPEFYYPY